MSYLVGTDEQEPLKYAHGKNGKRLALSPPPAATQDGTVPMVHFFSDVIVERIVLNFLLYIEATY